MPLILGIDPGTRLMGYALLDSASREARLRHSGVLRMGASAGPYERLQAIHAHLNGLISEYRPEELAIEAPFHGKNVQAMLKLGRAQGVAITVALTRGLAVHEYAPGKVKRAVTGNGNASKERVAAMLPQWIRWTTPPETEDESDAVAIALCRHFERQLPAAQPGARQYGGWEAFVRANPDRLS
jgi:crossover junction endodeoxyribonuclease RuvC